MIFKIEKNVTFSIRLKTKKNTKNRAFIKFLSMRSDSARVTKATKNR